MSIENIVEDWDNVKKRWEAWWNCELHDRVVISIDAPKDNVPPADIPEVDNKTKWTDVDFMIRRQKEINRTSWYGGEAMPFFGHGWSVGHALPFGCEPSFQDHTIWAEPAPIAKNGYPSFDGWQQSPWWDWMLKATEKAVKESRGEYFVMPAWGNNATDTLTMIRGSEQLLIDIMDNPDWVTEAMNTVSDILIKMFRHFWQIIDSNRNGIEGSLNYTRSWSPGFTMAHGCDLACMIPPDIFKRIFLPTVLKTMDSLGVDHFIYHFDGAIALHQMDTILETPEIDAIQWAPGAGREEIMQWIPVIKKVQERGKAILVYTTPEEIEPLLREVSPKGLFISTGCATESEGRKLLERVAKL
ncbi:MAG: hypothetical protein DRI61_13455 [Chloroflexi bacterium]|nr:MAG: hypothetical protein DRI61_13455 [Chloroflexota bacterium]